MVTAHRRDAKHAEGLCLWANREASGKRIAPNGRDGFHLPPSQRQMKNINLSAISAPRAKRAGMGYNLRYVFAFRVRELAVNPAP